MKNIFSNQKVHKKIKSFVPSRATVSPSSIHPIYYKKIRNQDDGKQNLNNIFEKNLSNYFENIKCRFMSRNLFFMALLSSTQMLLLLS